MATTRDGSTASSWTRPLFAGLVREIRLQSAVAFWPEFRAPWGVSVERDFVMFHIVAQGSCWLHVKGVPEALKLSQYDLVIVNRGLLHTLRDPVSAPVVDIDLVKAQANGQKGPCFPGDGAATRMICGAMHLENRNNNPMLSMLPPVLNVKADENGGRPWLRLTTQYILTELENEGIGSQEVVNRLLDVLFYQAVRTYFEENVDAAQSGWLGAVRDPQVGRALALLHSKARHKWTITSLAREVAMSRSMFASRFKELVGEPPQHYFTRLRISAAAARLRSTNDTLKTIGAAAGYKSVPAFVKSFKRHTGMTPGEYRMLGDRWPDGRAS
jgi:AraC-like DNA-binding protein